MWLQSYMHLTALLELAECSIRVFLIFMSADFRFKPPPGSPITLGLVFRPSSLPSSMPSGVSKLVYNFL